MFAMLHRRFPVFLLLTSLFLTHCATPPKSEAQSFLWEARRGDERMALVGTMHIGIEAKDMDPLLWDELARADTVIVETDLNSITPDLIQKHLLLPPGPPLSDRLGPEYWPRFLEILRRSQPGLQTVEVQRLTPLAAGSRLLLAQAKAEAPDETQGEAIDQIIFARAKAAGKRQATFETLAEQFLVLEKVFTMEQLKEMIDNDQKEAQTYKTLREAFKAGDAAVLQQLLDEIPDDMRGVLLDERNRKWMERLPKLKGQGRTLVAVGAAHFAGPASLLKLLENEGWTIRTLASPAAHP